MTDRAVARLNFKVSAEPTNSELAARIDALHADVRRLLARSASHDPRLGAVLAMVFAFAHGDAWSAGELLHDSRRADRDLWTALDAICGGSAKSLGRWLERHDGAAAGGYRLTRIKREGGTWVYAVSGD